MKSNVVLDTNVIVSAMYSPHGNPSRILEMYFEDKLCLWYSADILEEYKDVLSRMSPKLDKDKVNRFFEILRRTGNLFSPTDGTEHMTDESDRKFYDLAMAVDACLITGNLKHYPEGAAVLPRKFLDNLEFD